MQHRAGFLENRNNGQPIFSGILLFIAVMQMHSFFNIKY